MLRKKVKEIFFLFLFCPALLFSQSQVDWGAISNGFSQTLNNERIRREQKKAELDNISSNSKEEVQNNTFVGSNKIVSYLSQSFKWAAVKELNDFNYRLKIGQINPNEFYQINRTCVNQFNYAINSCKILNDKFIKLENDQQRYSEVYNSILNEFKGLEIIYKSIFFETRNYLNLNEQAFKIRKLNQNNEIEEIDIYSFFYQVNSLF